MLCPVLSCMREFKIPRRRRPRKCRLKSEFAFFQSLLRLFQFAYFVKCKRTISGAEFFPIICKFRKRKKISSSLLLFLHKTWHYFLIGIFKSYSCSRACSDSKECTKKRAVCAELLFCPSTYCLFDDLVILLRLADLQGKSETDELSYCVMTPTVTFTSFA